MEKYNFIENKWYSFNWDYYGKDCMVIAKIERFNHEMIYISWRKYLWDNTISIRDAYEYIDISNIKELSLCDIQQYLPEDHPEKIKVGSYLIRPDAAAPKALKITKITRGGYYIDHSVLFESHPLLRFATEEEINKAENKLENLEKEFVLPEKWWIKVTKENQYIVGTWIMDNDKQKGINDLAQHTSYIGGIFQYPRNYDYSWKCSTYTPKEHTEITFEQFKKYVMKEEDKVEMKPDYSNYPKVSFEELQIGSKFANIKYNTDIRTVTAKTVDTIYFSDSDGENQKLHKGLGPNLDCRLISHPTSECKVIPEPEVLEMVPIDKYFKIRN